MRAALLSAGIVMVCPSNMIALRMEVSEQARNGLRSAQAGHFFTYITNSFHIAYVTITCRDNVSGEFFFDVGARHSIC